VNRQQPSRSRLKRFYEAAWAEAEETGWRVVLDGRPVRSPQRAPLVLPTRALAEAIAAEWEAQEAEIRPEQMPLTRLANSAIDRAPAHRETVISGLVAYAETDLLCYRAQWPQELVARQAQAWDPILDWARCELGADFRTVSGVMPVAQPDEAMSALGAAVRRLDDFALTALNQMASLSASVILALAVERRELSAEDAWRAAHIDEDWQIGQWGEDAVARQRREAQWADMAAAERFLVLARAQG
jgi:chaperone required for assembly of F1-ATPase